MADFESYVGKLKVVELKDELKKRNLSYAGVKIVLAQRLLEALNEEEKQSPQTTTEPTDGEKPTAEEPKTKADIEQEPVNGGVPDPEQTESSEEGSEGVISQVAQTDNGSAEVSKIDASGEDATTSEQLTEGHESQEPAETMDTGDTLTEVAQTKTQRGGPESTSENPNSSETVAEQATSQAADPQPNETAVDQPPSQSKDQALPEESSGAPPTDDSSTCDKTEGPTAEKKEQDSVAPDEKMETGAVTDKPVETGDVKPNETSAQSETSSVQLGVKRSRDEDGVKAADSVKKLDPSTAPDPEEPEEFDEDQVLMEIKFTPPEDDNLITLDSYTSDIYFQIRSDGLGGCGLTEHGFARLWATARASWGIKSGKYFYEVKVDENIEVDLPDTEEHPHCIRVGWTVDEARKGFGEELHSYGYGSTGKSSTNNVFNMYGESFGPGDVIACFVDFESTPGSISFSKNGNMFGSAFELNSISGKSLFPCVSTKNVSFSVNFGGSPNWSEVPEADGYSFIQEATEEHKTRAPTGPLSPSECEVIMMIGLPASGKTTWAEKHSSTNPDKRYTILGTNLIMEKMKVSMLARKQNYNERWEMLIKMATDVLNKLFLLAAKSNRNYIIDQTNVYQGAQNRKMKYFDGFVRRCQIVVPPHHELRRRTTLRNTETGSPLPEKAINAMKANFHIPLVGDVYSEVNYSDIYGIAAEKIVRQYREDALGLPSYPQSKRGRYEPRDGHRGGWNGPPRGGGGYSPQYYNRQPQRHNAPYEYSNRSPYSSYGQQSPPMYGPPRGGGGYRGPRQPYRSPYGSPRPYGYRGSYGGGSQPRRGRGYYGRY